MVETKAFYILFYDLVDDYLNRRGPLREQHLAQLRQAAERGAVVMAGALANPADQAVLVFRSKEAAEDFAKADPYVVNKLVKSWRVREWTTVVL